MLDLARSIGPEERLAAELREAEGTVRELWRELGEARRELGECDIDFKQRQRAGCILVYVYVLSLTQLPQTQPEAGLVLVLVVYMTMMKEHAMRWVCAVMLMVMLFN